jgi:hypothetical protein
MDQSVGYEPTQVVDKVKDLHRPLGRVFEYEMKDFPFIQHSTTITQARRKINLLKLDVCRTNHSQTALITGSDVSPIRALDSPINGFMTFEQYSLK